MSLLRDTIGFAAIALLGVIGLIMFFSPRTLTKADKKDDPEALKQVKNGGIIFMAAAAGAALHALKYTLT